jgi:hypothetical protein
MVYSSNIFIFAVCNRPYKINQKEEIRKLLLLLIEKFENQKDDMKKCRCIHFACHNCNQIEKFNEKLYFDEAWIRDCPDELSIPHCKFCYF